MANEKRIPNYKAMYPNVSDEVISVLRRSERKQQYHEYDLKSEKFVVDQEKQKVIFIPSREDSLERLVDADVQFEDENVSVEEEAIQNIMIQKLRESLTLLNAADLEMILALFFEGKTETEYALETGILQQTINYRKQVTVLSVRQHTPRQETNNGFCAAQ